MFFYFKKLLLLLRSAVTSSEARLDIKAGGFWARGVTTFFDVRVTHVNSKCYQSKPTSEVRNSYCKVGEGRIGWGMVLSLIPLRISNAGITHSPFIFSSF